MYQERRPMLAVTALNEIMTVNQLLNGFVTMFVAVCDVTNGQLTYSSCGHEPAMIHRSTDGSIVTLHSNGMPIGIDCHAVYAEDTFLLNNGDSLLIYTDGLSEAGPDRNNLLGAAGLETIFADVAGSKSSMQAADCVVNEVRQFANGAFKDDICVLVAQRCGI